MKKLFLLTAAALILFSCGNNVVKYTIDGNVANLEAEYAYLIAGDSRDSVKIEDGKFTFTGQVEKPEIYRVLIDRMPLVVFLEEGTIVIEGDYSQAPNITATGTPLNDEYYINYKGAVDKLVSEYQNEETTDERKEEIIAEANGLSDRIMNDNLDNLVGVHIFASEKWYGKSINELEEMIAAFSPEMQQTKQIEDIKKIVETMRKTEVGQPFIDFTLPTPDGDELSLSDVVGDGKVVLLDFWASWCGPCIAEVPHLKAAYDKYHPKGFEIFGVSLDANGKNWTEAIDEYDLNWYHVSALQGWSCPAGAEYGVRSIPASVLIGPNGTIVAKNLRGNALSDKLAELLD